MTLIYHFFVCFTPVVATGPVSGLMATEVLNFENSQFKISWKLPELNGNDPHMLRYIIKYCPYNGSNLENCTSTTLTNKFEYHVMNLMPEETYFYEVTVENEYKNLSTRESGNPHYAVLCILGTDVCICEEMCYENEMV